LAITPYTKSKQKKTISSIQSGMQSNKYGSQHTQWLCLCGIWQCLMIGKLLR